MSHDEPEIPPPGTTEPYWDNHASDTTRVHQAAKAFREEGERRRLQQQEEFAEAIRNNAEEAEVEEAVPTREESEAAVRVLARYFGVEDTRHAGALKILSREYAQAKREIFRLREEKSLLEQGLPIDLDNILFVLGAEDAHDYLRQPGPPIAEPSFEFILVRFIRHIADCRFEVDEFYDEEKLRTVDAPVYLQGWRAFLAGKVDRAGKVLVKLPGDRVDSLLVPGQDSRDLGTFKPAVPEE